LGDRRSQTVPNGIRGEGTAGAAGAFYDGQVSQRTESEREPQTAGLSVTQMVASALAAVTTTWALSYLGVAGTVIGAGLASIVTVLGNHLYAQSIERTRHQVRTYRPSRYAASARSAEITPTVALEVQDPTQPVPAITQEVPLLSPEDGATEDGALHVGAAGDGATEDGPPGDTRRSRRPMVVSIVVVFLLIMAAVTAFEILNGRSLSDTVRGTQGSGTTIFGGTGSTAPVPTPTGTSTSTPTASSTSTGTTSAVTSTTTTSTETSTSPTSSPSSTTPPEVTQTSIPPSVSATP